MTPADLLPKLSEAQRQRLKSFRCEPRQMGIGLPEYLPSCLAPGDINHPVFGCHYHLTPFGKQCLALLMEQQNV